MRWIGFLATLAALCCAALGGAPLNYVETGQCKDHQHCVYQYHAEERYLEGTGVTTFNATVHVLCNSVGLYSGSEATRYCILIKNSTISTTEQGQRSIRWSADEFLGGKLCFVQTEDGKITAIHHPPTENMDAVNIKKTIVSAFQANFKGTEEEEEADTQSAHLSHYSYTPVGDGNDGSKVIHRTYNSSDVRKYPGHNRMEEIELTRKEDIEFDSGTLRHSTGTMFVKVLNQPENEAIKTGGDAFNQYRPKRNAEEQPTFNDTFHANKLSSEDYYSLDLQYCSEPSRRARRDINPNLDDEFVESALTAYVNQSAASQQKMKSLRKKIPSVPKALTQLHQSHDTPEIGDDLRELLRLESQYGPLPGFAPALDDTLDYLFSDATSDTTADTAIRVSIYSFLSPEGSLRSQEALLDTFAVASDQKEKKSLIVYIAFARNPHFRFVSRLEGMITGDMQYRSSLLLAYGALTSKTTSTLHQHMVDFLLQTYAGTETDTSSLIQLIHCLGNTGSTLTVEHLINFLHHSELSVQLATINAMRQLTEEEIVQEQLVLMLMKPDITEEHIESITRTLLDGLEHSKLSGSHLGKLKRNSKMVSALASKAAQLNSPYVHNLIVQYLQKLNTEESRQHLRHLMTVNPWADLEEMENGGLKQKRAEDWADDNADYNLVESLADRQSDVQRFPHHEAYIFGENFGIHDMKVQAAAGAFAGVNDDGSEYKIFGRAVVKGTAFTFTATPFEAIAYRVKTYEDGESTIEWKLYVRVHDYILIDEGAVESPSCVSREWPLYDGVKIEVLKEQFSFHLLIIEVTVSVQIYAQFNAVFQLQLCEGFSIFELAATITPSVNVEARAEGSFSFPLGLGSAGLTADLDITYQPEPELSARFCFYGGEIRIQVCTAVYESWPALEITLTAWYIFDPGLISSFFSSLGVDTSGERTTIDALSGSWSLPSKERTLLWGICNVPQLPYQCTKPSSNVDYIEM